ncbi:hypothetical protein [Methylorubrum populi]
MTECSVMVEHAAQTVSGYVSVDLAARVAGISLAEMQRIAARFAKGSTEPWCGAVLIVRTERVLGCRHRDIAVASLAEWMREALATNRFRFRLAAEQVEPGAEMRPDDFLLLHRAVASGACPANQLQHGLSALCAGGPLLAATRENFDCLMDHFYGWGFRDDALSGISADYLDFLDRSRRQLGMTDRYYGAVLADLGGVDLPRRLDGAGFVRVADYMLRLGLPWTLPERAGMDRAAAGIINEARHQLGVSQADHEMDLITIAGGVLRLRDLDTHGFYRLHAAYLKAGYLMREPAPPVAGEPGYITQPQANLIWRLWQENGGVDGDTSAAGLDRWLGFAGGLASLTAAGAGKLIGEWLSPRIERRTAVADALRVGHRAGWETPICAERAAEAIERSEAATAPEFS